jgi:UDP-N-acetylglucosamine acyltransferase
MTTTIHPTAVVDPSAELADGVHVGPLAVIGPGVELGADCRVEASAQIQGPTRIGARNRFFPFSCIGFDPQDLKYHGEETRLEIGDDNTFREHCTINRGTGHDRGVTTLGSGSLFMTCAHVGHDCVVGDRTIFVNNATLGGHVEVGDGAQVGAFSSVHPFCRIGRHAYIGGYSIVTRDALPFVKIVGAKPVCLGVNRIGLERKGVGAAAVRRLEAAYRILVRSRLNTANALARLRAELGDDPLVRHLIEFVEGSSRGVITDLPGRGKRRGG